MGVIAGPPKNELQWWEHVIKHAEQSMSRLYRNGEFTNLGYEEACVRFGISFGELELEDGDVPVCFLCSCVSRCLIPIYRSRT
jgi:hypothetical protein